MTPEREFGYHEEGLPSYESGEEEKRLRGGTHRQTSKRFIPVGEIPDMSEAFDKLDFKGQVLEAVVRDFLSLPEDVQKGILNQIETERKLKPDKDFEGRVITLIDRAVERMEHAEKLEEKKRVEKERGWEVKRK